MDLINKVGEIYSWPLVIASISIAKAALFLWLLKKKKKTLPLPPKDSNIIILNTVAVPLPYQSPFALKLWVCFRSSGVDFTLREIKTDFSESPNHKIPYLFYRQEVLPDSHFIIKRLIDDKILPDFDSWLSPIQMAQADLLRHSLEFVLYWAVVKQRWVEYWPKTKEILFKSSLPWYLYLFLPDYIIQPGMKKYLFGTGVSRYLPQQWDRIVNDTMKNISVVMGENKFILGNQLCSLDFSLFGLLGGIYYGKNLNPEIYQIMIKYQNLVNFTEYMATTYLKEIIQ